MSVELVVSHFTKRALVPREVRSCVVVRGEASVESSGRASSRRSDKIIVAPSEAKARAMARPMPEEEPVIMAILLVRRSGMVVESKLIVSWVSGVVEGVDFI